MTWTRVCFTDRQVAAGEFYRVKCKFSQLYAEARGGIDMAMFSTAFLPGRESAIYFSPAVQAQYPAFATQVGAQACEVPGMSVAMCLGPVGGRDLLVAATD